jgi:RHS repeat-associated protein
VTVSGPSANPYQFTGRENDGTGLYFYRARYYSPTFQRFVSQDPIGLAGGGPNLYAYAVNAPTIFIDPFGLNYWSNGVEYNDGGTPIGELGLQPEPPIPDVTIGLDSPVGGVETTLPFGSGGTPTTVQNGPSYNVPLPGDYNLKLFPQTGPGKGQGGGQCEAKGPFGGVSGGVGTGGVNGNILGPQLNFPLPYGTNLYIGTQWNLQ